MKKLFHLFSVVAILMVTLVSMAAAQAPTPVVGDYAAVQSGLWSAASTWRAYSFSGSAFDSVVTGAPSSGKNVFIQSGDTVTYDTDSQNAKSLIVQAGGVLKSTAVLPAVFVLKINGPAVWVDGVVGSATDGFSIETKYNGGPLTIGGSGSITLGYMRPNSSQAEPLQIVFANNVTFNYAGSTGTGGSGIYFANRGAQKNVTVTVNPGVTLNFGTNSYFALTSSATVNAGANVTLNVNGTINLPGGSLIIADSAAYTSTLNIGSTGAINVGKKFTPYLSTGGGVPTITVADGGALNMLNGCTADFSNGSVNVSGAGTFALRSGATMLVGHTSGLDPVSGPVRTTSAVFEPAANYKFMATGSQQFGSRFPSAVNNLTIDTLAVDTSAVTTTVNGTLAVNGSLAIAGGTMTIDTATVYGTLSVANGGTADFSSPAATVTGVGSFLVQKGGTINVGAAAGLDSANGPVKTAIAKFDTAAVYGYTGSGLQAWGAQRPKMMYGLVIGANSVDSVLATDTLTVTGTLKVDGHLIDNGGLRPTGTTGVFNGTYQFNTVDTLSFIPSGVWNTGSTLLISKCRVGPTTGIPGINQKFFNITIDFPTCLGTPRLGFVNDTINGNLYLKDCATSTVDGTGNYIVMGRSGVSGRVLLMGDLRIDSAGSLTLGYGSGVCQMTLEVMGNVNTRGWMYMNGSGVANKYLLHGNFTDTNPTPQAIRGHSSTANPDSIIFCGTGTQNFVKPLAMSTMTNVRWRVAPGSTLSLNDTTVVPIGGIGSFMVDSAATLVLGHPNGLDGNITGATIATKPSSSFTFKGGSVQVTGASLANSINNLTIDNGLGVTLSAPVTVNGVLKLQSGLFDNTIPLTLGLNGSIARAGGVLLKAPVAAIATARKDLNADLKPDFLATNDTLKVFGVVTSPNFGSTYTSYYIQDQTAGINVYKGGTIMNFVPGDSVFVVGKILQNRGLTEISPLTADSVNFGIIKHNAVLPAPKKLTLHEAVTNMEAYEGQLITVDSLNKASGTWPNATTKSANVLMTDNVKADTLLFYVNANTNVYLKAEPQYPVMATGIASQYTSAASVYNNGYELIPRDTNDVLSRAVVTPAVVAESKTITAKRFTTSITNTGHIGGLTDFQTPGPGFTFAGSERLYEGSFLVATDAQHVSNSMRLRDGKFNPGFRFLRSVSGPTTDGPFVHYETAFDDSTQTHPLGIQMVMQTEHDTTNGAIFKYRLMLINKTAAAITNVLAGSFLDFDMTVAGNVDRGAIIIDSTNTIPGVNGGAPFKMNIAYQQNAGVSNFVAMVPLSQTNFAAARVCVSPGEIFGSSSSPLVLTDTLKYTYLSTFRATNTYTDQGANADLALLGSVGPFTLGASGADTSIAAFAIVTGTSLGEIVANARTAQKEYAAGNKVRFTTDVARQDEAIPTQFELQQNYPNPFNPATTLRYALPTASKVTLRIYNVLGQEVAVLVNGMQEAGWHMATWNAAGMASGMYLYRIEANSGTNRNASFTQVRKMLLLK